MFECRIVLNTKNYSRKVRDTQEQNIISMKTMSFTQPCVAPNLFYLMVH